MGAAGWTSVRPLEAAFSPRSESFGSPGKLPLQLLRPAVSAGDGPSVLLFPISVPHDDFLVFLREAGGMTLVFIDKVLRTAGAWALAACAPRGCIEPLAPASVRLAIVSRSAWRQTAGSPEPPCLPPPTTLDVPVGFTPLETTKLTADEPISGAFGIFAKGGARQARRSPRNSLISGALVPSLL